jgi:hypothetical protein
VQEHWLYNFELPEIAELVTGFQCAAKATDDNDPIIRLQKPRGKAGVAILWRNNSDKQIEVLAEGSERLIAIQIDTFPRKTCIVNT